MMYQKIITVTMTLCAFHISDCNLRSEIWKEQSVFYRTERSAYSKKTSGGGT